MKRIVQQEIKNALLSMGDLSLPSSLTIQVDYAREKSHGDFSSNIALVLAKKLQIPPLQLAEKIKSTIDCCSENSKLEKIEIAGPGFINFFLKKSIWYDVINQILSQTEQFGTSNLGNNEPILVEFVSANPTGPLHVGHGRGAAYGDSIARLLRAVGYQVCAEYYINDAGRQMDILATSVWLRYLEICGETFTFPSNAYRGNYVKKIAEQLFSEYDKHFFQSAELVFKDVPIDEPQGGNKEHHIDGLIDKAKTLLSRSNYEKIFETGLNSILSDIKEDLSAFRVNFDDWFSENSLFKTGFVDKTIKRLTESGKTYEANGALWFKSTDFGDDKDRVLLRENGQPTYFAADAAYRLCILEKREFKKIINVLGSDHHGYVPRVRAVIQALGFSADSLKALLVQFAILYRGDKKIQMSTRSGEFITLRELREEVGTDATRFFYVLRRADQHMDFDLELAKEQSNANPVYYVQYAYARISSVMRQLAAKQKVWEKSLGMNVLKELKEPQEQDLLVLLNRYPEILELAAITYEPHIIAHFLRDLAQLFHVYYNSFVFLIEDDNLRNARLNLIAAIAQVIKNGLNLLGVETLEVM
ncbi:arginine--tRNA ligase [Rickettsiella endosymbiont of Litargus connexus]|jgi:arginyl-tRNA synthetase|uniref:arginine--tRNA ligase n=1 Tax=Rickettsiella endosymbiont of Litargus connexus TaxID=3066237 RepID=UPI00376F2261|nr:arginine--tRNA ligase [Gammaproteobacteria bacterium]MDD4892677.1 arginine--tRNA ligase [Candidatus Rickettsiella isopodorum]MDD5161526.1 arginine--tRNA ligase [Candidatus Rickettsiella isopodorum]